MDDPVEEIPRVIHLLTQSSPSVQRKTIETYFLPNASFTHPFCRSGSFEGSRFLIHAIYRWYKIMSPRIELRINSVAYDPHALILYVKIFQIFRIWFIPFYKAPVKLVTVLQLSYDHSARKYYIASQDDLYQVNEFVRFIAFGGGIMVWAWQIAAMLLCLLGAVLLFPVSLWEERVLGRRLSSKENSRADGTLTLGEADVSLIFSNAEKRVGNLSC